MYLVFGLLLTCLSIPLLLKKVKPNSLYGFRVPKTMNIPEVWYAANHYAAKFLLASGLAITLAALVLYRIPNITVDQYSIAVLIVLLIFFVPGIILSFRYLSQLPGKNI
jgi:uncharacterized membrane protein